MRWHSLRRKLAADHKDGSLKVLCELGGWKSPKTVLECYQQADLESQRGLQASRYQPTPRPNCSNGERGLSLATRCIKCSYDFRDRWPSGSRRAPGERANVTSNDDILSLKPHEMYEFPHNVFFAVVVEVAF